MQTENNSTKKSIDNMSSEELTRWLCLFEAVDKVAERARELNIDINKNTKWVKPLSFKNYIRETYYGTLCTVCEERGETPNLKKPAYTSFEFFLVKNRQKPVEVEVETDTEVEELEVEV